MCTTFGVGWRPALYVGSYAEVRLPAVATVGV